MFATVVSIDDWYHWRIGNDNFTMGSIGEIR